MAGATGGLDKSTHTRIEERRCGYEHFSSPGLTVEKNFSRTKLMGARRNSSLALVGTARCAVRASQRDALHEMAGATGGLDESTHPRIEERRCGYEHFSGPGLTVEKNFSRTKLMGARRNSSLALVGTARCAVRASQRDALHEMAGATGGLDESTHPRIEERRCGDEHFSGPGLTVEKNFSRTKLLKTPVPHFCSATNLRSASSGLSVKLKSRRR